MPTSPARAAIATLATLLLGATPPAPATADAVHTHELTQCYHILSTPDDPLGMHASSLTCYRATGSIRLSCSEVLPHYSVIYNGPGHPHMEWFQVEYGPDRGYVHEPDRMPVGRQVIEDVHVTYVVYDQETTGRHSATASVIAAWEAGHEIRWEMPNGPVNRVYAAQDPDFPSLLAAHQTRCLAIVPRSHPPFRLLPR